MYNPLGQSGPTPPGASNPMSTNPQSRFPPPPPFMPSMPGSQGSAPPTGGNAPVQPGPFPGLGGSLMPPMPPPLSAPGPPAFARPSFPPSQNQGIVPPPIQAGQLGATFQPTAGLAQPWTPQPFTQPPRAIVPPPPMGVLPPPPLGLGPPPTPIQPPGANVAPPPRGMMPPMAPVPPMPGLFPPPIGGAPGVLPAMPGQDPYATQRLMDQFESLSLGTTGPHGPEFMDPSSLPRPTGDLKESACAAPPPLHSGNCSHYNMRLTVNALPSTAALRARWHLPLGVLVHPMADESIGGSVPVVSLGNGGIIRCRRCRTYMNPFIEWTDSGRRFKCNVCAMINEAASDYFCLLDQNGRRRDADERPELSTGTVEYVAPAEYMVRPPMPPVYFFVIDVTYAAVSSGMVTEVAQTIKSCLDKLPGDERTMVGILTFDTTLHFYNLKSSLSQPQMNVMAELDDPFIPLPDDLLVNLRESLAVVEAALDALPATFANTNIIDAATGPALQAAFMIVQRIGGKLLLFQASPPSLGCGRVKARDNAALYGTPREHTLRNPEDQFYKTFAAECSRDQISVDVFCAAAAATDLASLAAIPRFTCGDLHYYPGFQAAHDGVRLRADLHRNLTRPTAWEAVMRIRCSKGIRISSFHGHFFNRSTDLLALPTCDPDKAFAVQLSHEENVLQSTVAYIQCALLYTNSGGERRIRVHTMAVPVVSDLHEMYRAADDAACGVLLAKLGAERILSSRLDETRAAIQSDVTGAFKEFRILHAASSRASNRLIYPDTLRLLPLWSLATQKVAALRGSMRDLPLDQRIADIHHLMAAPIPQVLQQLYPDLYPLADPSTGWGCEAAGGRVVVPATMPLTVVLLQDSGAYLLDNGSFMLLWLGRTLAREWVMDVLGVDPMVQDASQASPEPARDTPLSQRFNKLLSTLRSSRPTHTPCYVLRQGTPAEALLAQCLVEDRTAATPSYADYMLLLYRGSQAK